MGHSHDHVHDSGTYYLDQLCLIALSGAFGGVCLTMYYWQTPMLRLILAPQFHPFVLWSGIALLVLVAVRAVTLWRSVGQPAPAQACCGGHTHDHGHEHGHLHHHHDEHGHVHVHDHEHAHAHHVHEHHVHLVGTQALVAAPEAEATHEHAAEADDDCGHDHGWSPWKYVLLLLPIMLYLLGLPNKGPQARADTASFDLVSQEARLYAGMVATGGTPLQQLGLAAAARADDGAIEGTAKQVGFSELERAAYSPETRSFWQGQPVQVVGQFAPSQNSDRVFKLVRFRIKCCAADAIPLDVPMICRENISSIRSNDWVRVKGRVEFREREPGAGIYITVLQIPGRQYVVPTDPDPNFYIQ
jgi:hypothetical protein